MLRLHWSPDSANLVIRIALHRLALSFETARVDRARAEQRSAAFLSLNPQGLLPVLEDDTTVLFETGAILLHLADREGVLGPDASAADDPSARTRFLRWLFYLSNTLHADLRVAFYTHRYVPEEIIPTLRAGLRTRIEGHLALLETEIARQGALTGGQPTLAEDYLGACVRWAQIYPAGDAPMLTSLEPWPRLTALLGKLEREAPVQAACREEHITDNRPYTAPSLPSLPPEAVTG